jgi:hypothetical protein
VGTAIREYNGVTPDLAANTRWTPVIGLRERLDDAVVRCERNTDITVSGATHCLLAFRFTEAGQAHYMKMNAGYAHGYVSMLQKQTYSDDHDWGVWHFHDTLPLSAVCGRTGKELVTAYYVSISG